MSPTSPHVYFWYLLTLWTTRCPGSSAFPVPALNRYFLLRDPRLSGRGLETKIWALGLSAVTEMSLLVCPFSGQSCERLLFVY